MEGGFQINEERSLGFCQKGGFWIELSERMGEYKPQVNFPPKCCYNAGEYSSVTTQAPATVARVHHLCQKNPECLIRQLPYKVAVCHCKADVTAVCHCRADVMAVCYCSADVMIVITLQALVMHDKVNQV